MFVLAGPNGAGKSTLAEFLLPESLGVESFVNEDWIAKGLAPHAPDTSAFRAGRVMLERLHELRGQHGTIAFETTLSSSTFAAFLEQARADGYAVHLVYVWLSSSDLAVERVRTRVESGGHDVPAEAVRRRYARSARNLFALYLPLADTWAIVDNSGEELIEVASRRSGTEPAVLDAARWEALRQHGNVEPRDS